jgi:predicted component of type VI protein secretion system
VAPAPPPSPPRPEPVIAAARLSGDKGQFALTAPGRFELGRAKTAAFRVEDSTVSRRHVALTLTDDRRRVVVEDLGAANGTRVNGVAVTAPRDLVHGDVLEMGEVRFTVTFERG